MSTETMIAGVEDETELLRRLPEIQVLRGRVRDEVIRVFMEDVHEHFWLARASEEHHPPDERGLGGTWLHTKRVFTAYTMLERSFRAMSAIDSFEANCARGSVLLHDAFKYGSPPYEFEENNEDYHEYADGLLHHIPQYSNSNHDVKMASHIRTETELPEEVAVCVERHGGPSDWMSHDGPAPFDDKTLLVHMADMFASNSNHCLPVYDPARELRMMSDRIEAIENDDWIEDLDEF